MDIKVTIRDTAVSELKGWLDCLDEIEKEIDIQLGFTKRMNNKPPECEMRLSDLKKKINKLRGDDKE